MRAKLIKKFPKLPGFTLIELMVTLSIITLLGGIVMSSSLSDNRKRDSVLADSTNLVVTLRDMQNRTTSFIENTQVNNVGYGVFLNLTAPNKIETFYKTGGDDFDASEVLNTNQPSVSSILNTGDYISKICLNGCSNGTAQKVAIYFVRPDPYATFAYLNGSTYTTKIKIAGEDKIVNHVCIEISPDSGSVAHQRVDIYYIGQISFSSGECDN